MSWSGWFNIGAPNGRIHRGSCDDFQEQLLVALGQRCQAYDISASTIVLNK